VNTSDADIVGAYAAKDTKATVTWKPQLSEILAAPDAQLVVDSSKIPGEIIDLMVVNTATLQDNPKLGKALVGAWYETMAVMSKKDPKALAHMAKASGTDTAGFNAQLATTKMFWTAAEAHAFMTSPGLPKTMDLVRKFSFDHGLLGEGAKTADAVGIAFPAGQTLGNAKAIKMRFDPTYTKQAVDGAL
jgi:NitT/TauT family transport system substrate-binding protein